MPGPGLRRIGALGAMAELPRPVWLLVSASGLSNIGSGLVLPFLVVYLHSSLGFEMLAVTSTYSVTAVCAVLGSLVAGHCVDRYGAHRTFAAFSVVSAMGTCGYAAVGEPWHALVTAGVFGLGLGGNAGFSSALAVAVPAEQRALAFGTNFAMINAAIAVGSVLGGLVVSVDNPGTFRLLYVLNAVSYLVAGAIVLRSRRATAPASAAVKPSGDGGALRLYGRLLRDRRLVLLLGIAVVLYFSAYGQLQSGLPALVITGTELEPSALSVIFAANTAMVVAAQLILGARIKQARPVSALRLAAALWFVTWVLVALALPVDGTVVPLVLLCCAVGVFAVAECLVGAALPATVNAIAPEHLRGRYNAANGIVLSLGMALGPLAAGSVLGGGNHGAYLVMVMAGCLAGLSALWTFESTTGSRSADMDGAKPRTGIPDRVSEGEPT